MGEHCFDPQIGLYEKDKEMEAAPTAIEEDKNVLPSATSLDRNMIECKKKQSQFDIFCGKAKDQKNVSKKLQIWVDTSSSMSQIDGSDAQGDCFRKSLVKRLRDKCASSEDLDFYVFDTSKKQLGSFDSLCLNVGLNDSKKLIQWIKEAEVKKLIVITDIYELSKNLADFIEMNGGLMAGDQVGRAINAEKMLEFVPKVAKSCQKK